MNDKRTARTFSLRQKQVNVALKPQELPQELWYVRTVWLDIYSSTVPSTLSILLYCRSVAPAQSDSGVLQSRILVNVALKRHRLCCRIMILSHMIAEVNSTHSTTIFTTTVATIEALSGRT